MISGPVSTTVTGFLFAKGDAGSVLRVVVLQATLWIGVTAALVPFVGATAAGIGMLGGALSVALMMRRYVNRHTPVDVVHNVWRPTATALVASLAGWATVAAFGTGPAELAGSLALVLAVYMSGIWFAQRDAARLGARTLKLAVAR
jgi:hypothetical protein